MNYTDAILDRLRTEQTLATNGGHPILANSFKHAIAEIERLRGELSAACGYMRNASIDLSTGCPKATAIRTIEDGLKRFEAALQYTTELSKAATSQTADPSAITQ